MIRERTTDRKRQSVEIYLRLMFTLEMNEEMLGQLNPLREVGFQFSEQAKNPTRFLRFNFTRILENGSVSALLATVNDGTEQVLLANRLKETEQKSQNRMEMLFNILHVDPHLLLDFLVGFEHELQNMEIKLKKIPDEPKHVKEMFGSIYRSTHTIKGNAGLLALNFIAEAAHELEDLVMEAQNSEFATRDMNALSRSFEDMNNLHRELREIFLESSSIRNGSNTTSSRRVRSPFAIARWSRISCFRWSATPSPTASNRPGNGKMRARSRRASSCFRGTGAKIPSNSASKTTDGESKPRRSGRPPKKEESATPMK